MAPGLADKPEVIALNKCDTDRRRSWPTALAAELAAESGAPVFAVSGATGAGVDAMLDALIDRIGRRVEARTPSAGRRRPGRRL